jgi:hypothetical protein
LVLVKMLYVEDVLKEPAELPSEAHAKEDEGKGEMKEEVQMGHVSRAAGKKKSAQVR